jgi:hypothetical protein
MVKRYELNEKLCLALASAAYHGIVKEAENHVYYQPPENLKLSYPCIIYEWDGTTTRYADNRIYSMMRRYTVTVIDRDPDSQIPLAVAKLPMCSHDRNFISDGLYHFVYTLYYQN